MQEKTNRKVREIDPRWVLFKAIAVLLMLVVAITGMSYTIWLLCTLPAKK